MTQLLVTDSRGRVQSDYAAGPPRPARNKLGDKYGLWAGREGLVQLPNGGMLMFDLTKLNLSDYRAMRDHYQMNASLSVLSFILHQIEWKIECENQTITDFIEEEIEQHWTRLIRGLSTAFWAGYSPIAVNYQNDPKSGYLRIDKFKDLVPEECRVQWKKIDGYAPPGETKPKINQFDGIKQSAYNRFASGGASQVIPVENSLWYPLMMENGDFYGKKLLRPAFPSWYFSTLMHMYANRYYERFGEPTPVGRAPLDQSVVIDGTAVPARDAMADILNGLRNRSVVVLPNDRAVDSKDFDWTIEYLESQMRGADFERYMGRLDEEMSLAVFTPVLLFRTSDVGSYNLGEMHMKVFLWMLNSIAGDLKLYIQKYVVDRLVAFNFGESAPRAEWTFRRLGKDDADIYRQMLMEIVRVGKAMPDLEELGAAVGLTLNEVEIIVEPGATPGQQPQPGQTSSDDKKSSTTKSKTSKNSSPRDVIARAIKDMEIDLTRQWHSGRMTPAFGRRKEFIESLVNDGMQRPEAGKLASRLHGTVNDWLSISYSDRTSVFGTPERFVECLSNLVYSELG
jgi:hypothetical protein